MTTYGGSNLNWRRGAVACGMSNRLDTPAGLAKCLGWLALMWICGLPLIGTWIYAVMVLALAIGAVVGICHRRAA